MAGVWRFFYFPKNQKPNIEAQVSIILKELEKKKVKVEFAKLKKDLMESPTLRADFFNALNLKGKVTKGVKYYASGRFNEYIQAEGGQFRRVLPNGVYEVFDTNGRLVRSLKGLPGR